MPLSYAKNVQGNDKLFFIKLLLRWSGSVYAAVFVELIVFCLAQIFVGLIYRFALDSSQQQHYIHFMKYVELLQKGTPLSFMLGFFVSAMIDRWWKVCLCIPWLNTPAFLIQSYIPSCAVVHLRVDDEYQKPAAVDRQLRRCILRYLNLSWLLQMTSISQSLQDVFKDFSPPEKGQKGKTIRQKLESINSNEKVRDTFGELVIESEIQAFEEIADVKELDHCEAPVPYWVPIQWASRLLQSGYDAGLIEKDRRYRELTQMLADFRSSLGTIWFYSDTNTPLVYTQVVIIAVYSYFLAEIFTSQICAINPINAVNGTAISEIIMDPYVPIISILQFLFYVGWFKVAVALMDPLGNDVQDFPLMDIFEYNLEISCDCGLADDYIYPKGMAVSHSAEAAEHFHSTEGVRDPHRAKIMRAYETIHAASVLRRQPRKDYAARRSSADIEDIKPLL